MKQFWAISTFCLVLLASQANAGAPSATRENGESWRAALLKHHLRAIAEGQSPLLTDNSAYGSAGPITGLDLSRATEWTSESRMIEIFNQFRDFRFYPDPQNSSFLRRSSWLYPDDGCFARAGLFVQNMDSAHLEQPLPSKVFIFGDLEVKTPNSPSGSVRWWYHVVPAARIGNQVYILDPAIEPRYPLPLVDWVMTMVPDPANANLSICNAHTYGPSDSCDLGGGDSEAFSDQGYYLTSERSRLEYMNRNADQELGDTPPWLVAH